ncbi:MAG: hypothetical protein MUF61_01095 [archaeon]|jgi:hypothetical protein|nr:hypothetical protein [archaeon]
MDNRRPEFVRESPEYAPKWYEVDRFGAYMLAAAVAAAIAYGPIIVRETGIYSWLQDKGLVKKVENKHRN